MQARPSATARGYAPGCRGHLPRPLHMVQPDQLVPVALVNEKTVGQIPEIVPRLEAVQPFFSRLCSGNLLQAGAQDQRQIWQPSRAACISPHFPCPVFDPIPCIILYSDASEKGHQPRWRTASNKPTAVATDTFRLSTVPRMGTDSRRSHCSLTSRRIPFSSPPITMTSPPLRSVW